MKLSVSVRVAEKFDSKRESSMDLASLGKLASEAGFAAICMRASQVGTHTPVEQVAEAGLLLGRAGLEVSMVTGDFPIPENSDEGPAALRNITPYLDLAGALGSDLLRVCMKTEEDISWAQRASDEAEERGMRLVHQCHAQSLFEQVNRSLEVVGLVGRDNFGMVYEPANLELCGEDYGAETIKKLAPHIFNVYLQNQKVKPDGSDVMKTWVRGDVTVDQVPIWEPGGIDYPMIIAALKDVGYDKYVTVHQASTPPFAPADAIGRSAEYLRSVIGL